MMTIPLHDLAAREAVPSATREFRFAVERAADRDRVDRLIEDAFGPGRLAKTAERLREQNLCRADLSFCAWSEAEIVAAVRQWPISIGETPALFLGPIAVRLDQRRQGLGRDLAGHAIEMARITGERIVLLVGDLDFFGPLGFRRVAPGQAIMPGPVNAARLLWVGFEQGGAGPGSLASVSGKARPRAPQHQLKNI